MKSRRFFWIVAILTLTLFTVPILIRLGMPFSPGFLAGCGFRGPWMHHAGYGMMASFIVPFILLLGIAALWLGFTWQPRSCCCACSSDTCGCEETQNHPCCQGEKEA